MASNSCLSNLEHECTFGAPQAEYGKVGYTAFPAFCARAPLVVQSDFQGCSTYRSSPYPSTPSEKSSRDRNSPSGASVVRSQSPRPTHRAQILVDLSPAQSDCRL